MAEKTSPQHYLLLAVILLLGFTLRLWGIHFGLPHLYHADEPIVVNHALAYGTWDFHPHFFRIPPLVSYLLFGVYGIYFLAGRLTGFFSSVQEFEFFFYEDPSAFYLIARVLFGAVLGTLTIYFFYRLLQRHFLPSLGLAGAFLLSVAFLHVRDSHYIYADIPLVFVMVLAFGPILSILDSKGAWRTHALCGLFIGLAAAVKYNGVSLVIPYLVASLFGTHPKSRLPLAWLMSGFITFFTYFCLNPFSILDFNYFLQESRAEAAVHPGFAWDFPLRFIFPNAVGWPLLISAIGGIAFWLKSRDPKRGIILSFIFCYYVIICLWGQPYGRYGLPLVPFLLFFSADFLHRILSRRPLYFILALVLVSPTTLLQSIYYNVLMTRKDTRTLAKEWIESNISDGSGIAMEHEFYAPRLALSKEQLLQKQAALETGGHRLEAAKLRKLNYRLQNPPSLSYELWTLLENPGKTDRPFLFSMPAMSYAIEELIDQKIEYVVLIPIEESRRQDSFYRELEQRAKLVAEFNPYIDKSRNYPLVHPLTGGPFTWRDVKERERNGFLIKIYRIQN